MGFGADRKAVLEKYGPYVRSLAATVRKQFHAQLELDELIAYGQVGLLEAADRFDPKVGANFLTFAHYRIKGSIFDGLRKMGILRGADARNAYISERASSYLSNVSDRDSGGSNRRSSFGDDVRDVSDAVTGLVVVIATALGEGEGLFDESLPADQRLEMEELKARVRAAVEELPEKERKLLQGYYFSGKTLEEAGAEIGQSKSWASRLHARAIESLKVKLAASRESESAHTSARRRELHGGSTRGDSAAQIAQQKIQDQTTLPKQGASKFDGMLADKAQAAQPAGAADPAQAASKASEVTRTRQVDATQQVTETSKAEKATLSKTSVVLNTGNSVPVTAKPDATHPASMFSGMVSDMEKGQGAMDNLIKMGLSGKKFSNGELLSLQAGMYKYTQELELTGKVVEKATSGLKDTLKTQV